MREIIALQLFVRNGVQLYTGIIGAKYVEKRITLLFDDFDPRQTSKRQMRQRPAAAATSQPHLPLAADSQIATEAPALAAEAQAAAPQIAAEATSQQWAKLAPKAETSLPPQFLKKWQAAVWEQLGLLPPTTKSRRAASSRQEAYLNWGAP